MARIAGVDGCPFGWVVAIESDSAIEVTIVQSAREILALGADVFAVDIPIGLTEGPSRRCDLLARRLLGPKRGASVFPAPLRSALLPTRIAADRVSRALSGKGVSAQSFGIYRKVKEWDEYLREVPSDAGNRVWEVHPEVCFWWLNGRQPILESKKTQVGLARRLGLLPEASQQAFFAARTRFLKRDVGSDDIVDALAALETARRIRAGAAISLPEPPDVDAHGIPICITY